MIGTRRAVLYTAPRCHLCEQAKALVYPLLPAGSRLAERRVDADQALAPWRERIPVLAVEDGEGRPREVLPWPFTRGQARRLLARHGLAAALSPRRAALLP
ncbi:MAG: hypothetical protein KatS3mg124_0104 [Porticoccaceae bacterium]|nr:MAG: hypothetical protein KatS3mg124_0104 [Porticoccaceae bacterium]